MALGISWWKRGWIGPFLRAELGAIISYSATEQAAIALARRQSGVIAVWASRESSTLATRAAAAGIPILRIEDGFIRSVGLGAKFAPAASLVIDGRGIYFDPATASDLEILLEETNFSPAFLTRSRVLIDEIDRKKITKYNVGETAFVSAAPPGRRRVFVPGQVEDDQSVLRGGQGLTRNFELLCRVRAERPDAWLIYKPHPDVDAGLRVGAVPDSDVLQVADEVVRNVSSARLIEVADEIHTLTSLCGFEALLRSKPVTTYGQPFYAGWGLTQDKSPVARRCRILCIEALAGAALILYPRYRDPATGRSCEVEDLIARLSDVKVWRPSPLMQIRHWQGRLLPVRKAVARLRRARL